MSKQNPIISSAEVDAEKDFSNCYFSINNGMGWAIGMLAFGAQQFKDAKCVKDLAVLDIIAHTVPGNMQEVQKRVGDGRVVELATAFAFAQLTDDVRIICCLENYMKAELLSQGYLIHNVSTKKTFKALSEKQKSKPVTVDELLAIAKFQKKAVDNSNVKYEHPGLHITTLKMSTLLNDGYQELIQLPNSVYTTVKKLNERRNKVHFFTKISLMVAKEMVNDIAELDRFVDAKVLTLHNKLQAYTLSTRT